MGDNNEERRQKLRDKVVALVREFAAEDPSLTIADLEYVFGRRHHEDFYVLDALRHLSLKTIISV